MCALVNPPTIIECGHHLRPSIQWHMTDYLLIVIIAWRKCVGRVRSSSLETLLDWFVGYCDCQMPSASALLIIIGWIIEIFVRWTLDHPLWYSMDNNWSSVSCFCICCHCWLEKRQSVGYHWQWSMLCRDAGRGAPSIWRIGWGRYWCCRSWPDCDEMWLMGLRKGFKIEFALQFPIHQDRTKGQCSPMFAPLATNEMNWNGKPVFTVARCLGQRYY